MFYTMNKVFCRIVFLFCGLVSLISCGVSEVRDKLNDVESYIMERPDSALAVLDSMDRAILTTDRLKAHHSLLLAMALDKNYIDVTDDSLARVAVNYYSKRGSEKNLARAMYYQALAYFYDGQYEKSIIELSKAEPIAAMHDSLYLGLTKVLQAEIYSSNFNEDSEIKLLEDAMDIYIDLNIEYHINVAKRSLAVAYTNVERFDDAERLLKELISSENINSRILTKSLGDYAFLMAVRPDSDYEEAVNYYEKTVAVEDGRYMSKQDYWVWAHALAETGDFDRSQQIVDMLSPIDTSGTAYYWQYEIAKLKGDKDKAFELFEEFSRKNNQEVVQILKQSISSVQRDYYQSQYEISDYKLRVRSLILYIVTLSSIIVIALIVFSVIRYRRRKDAEKEYYISYAEEVNRQLDEFKNGTYSALQKKYISMHKEKYETLQTLFEKFLQSDGRIDAEKLVYKKVVSLINELKKDIQNSSRFDKILDSELDGIMTNLKTEFPKLNQRYYMLFGYLALGFNYPIISHFMGCSENAVRIIKNRLKSTIKNSDAEHKSEFLEVIG